MKYASTGQIWLARAIALVLMAFGIGLLGVYSEGDKGPYTHAIRITVEGNPGQVLSALEALNRPDLKTHMYERPWYEQRWGFLPSTAGMTVSLALLLGFYHALYCAVRALLSRIQRDQTLIEPV